MNRTIVIAILFYSWPDRYIFSLKSSSNLQFVHLCRTMNPTTKAYIHTHLAVFLWGFTAILGKLISLSAFMLVWWRVLITSISLYILVKISGKMEVYDRKTILRFAGIGVIIGIHWLCFYGAIKYANASIALICMATTAFFTAILEPVILKRSFQWYEIGIGLLIIPGMALIINDTPSTKLIGIAVGVMAALLATVFTILNKKYILDLDPIRVSMIEIASAFLFLTTMLPLLLYFNPHIPLLPVDFWDWTWIITLALVCTTLPFVISLDALKHISAFAANLIVNLEPIYGIILAIFILQENQELGLHFYIGAATILAAVLFYPYIKSKFEKILPEMI